jgi:hypothetical protein
MNIREKIVTKLRKLSLLVLLLLIAGVLLFTGFAAAAEVPSVLTITGVQVTNCSGPTMEGAFQVIATNDGGSMISAPVQILVYFESNVGAVPGIPYTVSNTNDIPFAVSTPGGTVQYMRVYVAAVDNPSLRSDTWQLSCDGSSVNLGGGNLAADGADDRLNRSQGDLLNVLYSRTDRDGLPGVHVYRVIPPSQGSYEGGFSYQDFQPYLDNPPAENTLLASVAQSSLYALTSGEFQINIGPDIEGKTYVMIFSGLPPKNIRFSQFYLYAASAR